jgi:hypothetical protein
MPETYERNIVENDSHFQLIFLPKKAQKAYALLVLLCGS